ncbi:MAG: hypothetical protein A3G08_01610 [Candidatus Magasanikbacteria bacterium RIFCSPLOWO2_12_FULL_47_9b]|nr:MAG: hypothetical protein A3G08_01610 [Candidatus Magasanikbacteria bacterium RIFCSPLOWO2_12_FULL_47_9b]
MKIFFSGGGTLGPVTPLLAMREMLQHVHPDIEYRWVGTKRGPEAAIVKEQGIPFITLSSGKFRRYISIWNVVDIVRVIIGFFQSLRLLWREKPDVCITAGAFISVPLHCAAWVLGIPCWVHQQDVRIGLANKLIAPFATKITTALKRQVISFNKKKPEWLGNPVRPSLFQATKEDGRKRLQLKDDMPVIFATGGGTGSQRVNQLIVEAVGQLTGKAQVIHLTGKERSQELAERAQKHARDYHVYQFFTNEMKDAYAAADIIISRGGFGTITEIAAFGKPAILIPKPGHQDENVQFLQDQGAVLCLNERTSDGNQLAKVIRQLLEDAPRQKTMVDKLSVLMPCAKEEDIFRILHALTG